VVACDHIAKQMVKERQDITGSNCLKGVSGKAIVDEKGIKDSWKEYMKKLMSMGKCNSGQAPGSVKAPACDTPPRAN